MNSSLKAFCVGSNAIELQTVEVPAPAAGWALVRVRNCGICGSDLHFFRGEFPPPQQIALGHEISGDVVEVGEGVVGVSVGDRVVVEPLIVCRRCSYCLAGNPQLCPERRLMGSAADGGLAEYIAVPDYALHHLPNNVPYDVGALAEPLAVCVHGLRLVELRSQEDVLILGAGTIGLLTIMAARELGASRIAITARHPHQADLARKLGATEVLPADDGERLGAYVAVKAPDVVVETVGGEANTLAVAVSAVRPGGRVSVLGVFTRPVALHPLPLLLKEVRLVGSLMYGCPGKQSDFAVSIEILERRWRVLQALITDRVQLRDVAAGFERAMDKASGTVKVTVEP